MSGAQPMGPVRRRIPGMTSQPSTPDPPPSITASPRPVAEVAPEAPAAAVLPAAPVFDKPAKPAKTRSDRATRADQKPVIATVPERRPAVDYASTRLVNFRIPVDLHDRYRALVQEAESKHPRLRRPSLTELVIALLEEGPQTADEVAELIRRKRVAEHEAEA